MTEKTSFSEKSRIEVCSFRLIFPVRDHREMELPAWEGNSFELARALVEAASGDSANAHVSLEEKSEALGLTLGFHWTKKAIEAVGAATISGLAQRAMRHPCAKEVARNWRPPPALTVATAYRGRPYWPPRL